MNRAVLAVALVGCVLCGASSSPSATTDSPFKVVAHPAVSVQLVDRATLSAIFLKQSAQWRDGTTVQPVDQSARSPVRESFSEAVHGEPVAAVLRFWSRQIAEGRGVPPPVKASDDDVVAFVASKPGAVGYVAASVRVPRTVRVLQVTD